MLQPPSIAPSPLPEETKNKEGQHTRSTGATEFPNTLSNSFLVPHLWSIQSSLHRAFSPAKEGQLLCTFGCFSYLVKVIANSLLWTSFTFSLGPFSQSITVCINIECFIVFHAQASLCLLHQAHLSMLPSWIIGSVAALPKKKKKRIIYLNRWHPNLS